MAIVKAPALSLEASGNLGGINYTRWRGRAVARSSWIPTIPNTGLQVAIQQFLSIAVTDWRTVITADQRQAWNEYAKTQTTIDRLGNVRIPTGYNLYVGRSIQRQRQGLGGLFDPPTDNQQEMGSEIRFAIAGAGNRIDWFIALYFDQVNPSTIEGWAAGPFTSQARTPQSEEWRFVEYRSPPQRCRLTVTPGDWWWFRVRVPTADGRHSSWLQGQFSI